MCLERDDQLSKPPAILQIRHCMRCGNSEEWVILPLSRRQLITGCFFALQDFETMS